MEDGIKLALDSPITTRSKHIKATHRSTKTGFLQSERTQQTAARKPNSNTFFCVMHRTNLINAFSFLRKRQYINGAIKKKGI